MAISAEELKVGRIIHWIEKDLDSKYELIQKCEEPGRWALRHVSTGDRFTNYPIENYLDVIYKVISNKKRVFK